MKFRLVIEVGGGLSSGEFELSSTGGDSSGLSTYGGRPGKGDTPFGGPKNFTTPYATSRCMAKLLSIKSILCRQRVYEILNVLSP